MNLDKFYDKAYAWLLNVIPKLLVALLLLVVGLWLIRQVRKWATHSLERKGVNSSLKPFLVNFLFSVLQVLLVLVSLQVLGVQMTVFAALVGALGVAAGLALSGTLQNFTSGIVILLFKPYRVGDNIIAQGMEGTVTAIEIFYTVVTGYDNKTIIIPNSKLSNEVIVNISKEGTRRLELEFKLPFSIAFEEVKKVIEHIADTEPAVIKDEQTRIGITLIEGDGYRIQATVWFAAHGFHDARLAFQTRLVEAFRQSGLKLPGL